MVLTVHNTRYTPVSGWFTEGFDTPDLKAAQILLSELVSNV
ncbi:hypothetical protein [Microvirga roseola]|nr:hypothetical protein [Microvirga roseola]